MTNVRKGVIWGRVLEKILNTNKNHGLFTCTLGIRLVCIKYILRKIDFYFLFMVQ